MGFSCEKECKFETSVNYQILLIIFFPLTDSHKTFFICNMTAV